MKGEVMDNLKKGLALTILTGALISKNPFISTDNMVVYAKEDLKEYKDKYLNELKKIYKTYNKKLYTEKEYKKLTSKYNKGIKAINSCDSVESIENKYEKYSKILNDIKPSLLIKYQKKLEKSLLKTYKNLISKNEYSTYNLSKLENIKDEGIESIYNSKTKSKSKKNKNNYVSQLKNVNTLIIETKNNIINYINSNNDLTNNQKNEIINNINSLNNINDVISIGETYGYVYKEEYIETNSNKITLDILSDKDKLMEFATKYYDDIENGGYPGYYIASDHHMAYSGEESIIMTIYIINYQYVDPSITRKAYLEFFPPEWGYPEGVVEFATGSQILVREYNYEIDYDSLIIENDELKGVGKLINKLENIYLNFDEKGQNYNDTLKEYCEKYMGKNTTLDSIVFEISRNVSLLQTKEDDCIKKYKNYCSFLGSQDRKVYSEMYDEYFFSKNKTKVNE